MALQEFFLAALEDRRAQAVQVGRRRVESGLRLRCHLRRDRAIPIRGVARSTGSKTQLTEGDDREFSDRV